MNESQNVQNNPNGVEKGKMLEVQKPSVMQMGCGLTSLLCIICAPLPWFSTGGFGTASGFTTNFGIITLILAIFALAALLLDVASAPGAKYRTDIHTGLSVTGLVIAIVALVALRLEGLSESLLVDISPHVGLILTMVAGFLQFIMAGMMRVNISIRLA